MNKKGLSDFLRAIFVLIVLVLLIVFYWYAIKNPYVKIRDGCWTWQREKEVRTFSLIDDYNFTCQGIKDYIDLELWYSQRDYNEEIVYTKCKGEIIYNRTSFCYEDCFKEEYKERCLKSGD